MNGLTSICPVQNKYPYNHVMPIDVTSTTVSLDANINITFFYLSSKMCMSVVISRTHTISIHCSNVTKGLIMDIILSCDCYDCESVYLQL